MAGLWILFVDDERGNRVVFKHAFSALYPVQVAASAAEAIEFLKREEVAVFVTDQRMPEMSGNELLRYVKERYPAAVRIAVTAYSDLDPILEAVNAGLVARYVIKPWQEDELRGILDWAMEVHRAGRSDSVLQLRLLETERLATLGSMVAQIAHDLHQPLSSMDGNVDRIKEHAATCALLKTLADRAGGTLDPRAKESIENLAEELPEIADDLGDSCRVLVSFIAGIRDLVRRREREAPRGDPLRSLFYATTLCRSTLNALGGEIVYDGPRSLPEVRLPPSELTQLFINLVSNAAQAVERAARARGRVTVRASLAGSKVEIAVGDEGDGMTPEVAARAGTPFFSTRPDGLGLGLSHCRRLVEKAGGHLEIESAPGEGTTVRFSLDLA